MNGNRERDGAGAGFAAAGSMDGAIVALAGLDEMPPHEISRCELTLEGAFAEIDLLKNEIVFLKRELTRRRDAG